MYFEVTSRRNIVDYKGNDKTITEKYLVENCQLCSEAEYKVTEELNGENYVVAVKQVNIKEFVNESTNDDECIFIAVIESETVDEDGEIAASKHTVGLYDTTLEKATTRLIEYMKQGLEDMKIISLKKTKLLGVLK